MFRATHRMRSNHDVQMQYNGVASVQCKNDVIKTNDVVTVYRPVNGDSGSAWARKSIEFLARFIYRDLKIMAPHWTHKVKGGKYEVIGDFKYTGISNASEGDQMTLFITPKGENRMVKTSDFNGDCEQIVWADEVKPDGYAEMEAHYAPAWKPKKDSAPYKYERTFSVPFKFPTPTDRVQINPINVHLTVTSADAFRRSKAEIERGLVEMVERAQRRAGRTPGGEKPNLDEVSLRAAKEIEMIYARGYPHSHISQRISNVQLLIAEVVKEMMK